VSNFVQVKVQVQQQHSLVAKRLDLARQVDRHAGATTVNGTVSESQKHEVE
jgi:hypothetical protein